MKNRKALAGFLAFLMAVGTSSPLTNMSASALTLGEDFDGRMTSYDGESFETWYTIGGFPYWMDGNIWNMKMGDYLSINDEGTFEFSYEISNIQADPSMDGTGTLGCFGFIIYNTTPYTTYEVAISNAKFVSNDGTEYVLDTVNNMTEITSDGDGMIWLRCTPDEMSHYDESIPATPELSDTGWRYGGFKGGVFTADVDFGNMTGTRKPGESDTPETPEEPEKPEDPVGPEEPTPDPF